MPLKLDIKKLLSARSDRVKSVDLHPTEPWVLAALYSGTIMIWDYSTQALVRQMEVSNLPLRCAKFVIRRQWIIAGCDDMTVKILNYNTLEKIKSLEGHSDYIRSIAVHPTLPLVLTSSDDMTIKLWNWEQNWQCTQTYEGHTHYVMMVQWNPKDHTSFASASLDRSVKIWGTTGSSGAAHFTLNGHQRGVNCVDYASNGEKPYIVTGSDDKSVRVWDYQTKQCVHVLEGHTANVSTVVFHPTLPLILSGSEDGAVKLWHSTTYRLEMILNYMLDRVWSIGILPSTRASNAVAIGYDDGAVVVKLGSDDPVVSFCGGKLVWAKGVEIQTVNLKQITDESAASIAEDGEPIPSLPVKDMGACELFPQSISHHPSGRLLAVCGDGEYVIYTAQALRNKSFGKAAGFAWSPEGHYATRDVSGRISVFHNFKEAFSFKPDFPVEEIFSGELLAVKSANDFLVFYDWAEFRVIRRIDVAASDVYWSESGKFVAIAASDSVFILSFHREVLAVVAAIADEGIEDAFQLHNELGEIVRSACWVGDSCFVFVNDKLKLNTLVGGQVEVLAHLDHPVRVLGFFPDHARVYCCDKSLAVTSYALDLNLVKYKAAIVGNDFAGAEALFALIPEASHTKLARFMESQGFRAEALDITKDVDHKFELALGLGKLDLASELVTAIAASDKASAGAKRKMIGDKALEAGDFALAEKAFTASGDSVSLLLIASATGEAKLLGKVADLAKQESKLNVEITARFLAGDSEGCVNALVSAGMIAEAALFARTYNPALLEKLVPLWQDNVKQINPQLASAMGHPTTSSAAVSKAKVVELPAMAAVPAPTVVVNESSPVNASFQSPSSSAGKSPVHAPASPVKAPVLPPMPTSVVESPVPPPVLSQPTVASPAGPSPSAAAVRPKSATSRPLPAPPAMPSRISSGIPAAGPPPSLVGSALRGPPPMPSRPSVRAPETQVSAPSPESHLPVPNNAPESTNFEDDLM